ECGLCGGGFHAQTTSERYGCGWHRGRGPVVCENNLRVARIELEQRVFGAIRERILVPEAVLYAVERSMGLVAEKLDAKTRTPARVHYERLAEIEEELRTLRRLAERGRAREVARLVADLENERAALLAPDAADPLAGLDIDSLRPVIELRVTGMREAF